MPRFEVTYAQEYGWAAMEHTVVFEAANADEARRTYGDAVRRLGYACTADNNDGFMKCRRVLPCVPLTAPSEHRK